MQERMFYTEGNVSSYYGEGEKDIWKAYVRRGMNSEKGQMKLRLLDWGCTVERCRRLQEELRRLEEPEGTENAFLQEEFKAERSGRGWKEGLRKSGERKSGWMHCLQA